MCVVSHGEYVNPGLILSPRYNTLILYFKKIIYNIKNFTLIFDFIFSYFLLFSFISL